MINLLAKNFIFMKLAMKNAARQNQLSLPPLIIGFCIIVAMVKVIFQHPLWKTTHYRWRFVYDSSQLSQYLLS